MREPGPASLGGIPPLIKRNTWLFALSQSFIGAGTQLAYGIGPLMVIAVTGSASLAGLTVGLFGVSTAPAPSTSTTRSTTRWSTASTTSSATGR
jgi:hypothetical protein